MTRKKHKKKGKFIIFPIILFLVLIASYFIFKEYKYQEKKNNEKKLYEEIQDNYNEYLKTTKETTLYKLNNNEFMEAGKISSNVDLIMDGIKGKYYKLKNSDYYINYRGLNKIDKFEPDKSYKNYIPFNENVITSDKTKLYLNESSFYLIDKSLSLPIIIKENDKYYTEYDNRLVYIKKDSIKEVINSDNTKQGHTSAITVLNYHYVISKEANEHTECVQIICHTDTQFDEHMKYIKDNGFYTATLKELEMFIDGKIQLPSKTVLVTLDDGWYIYRAITILEKYNLHGILFLIGSLASPSDYTSNNLEIASHTWNLHKQWGDFVNASKETATADLKKSRESLNNTNYFCYPFYEYNDKVISYLKEVGFTMAFAGGSRKVTVGTNKYIVPRYDLINTSSVNYLAQIIN